MKNKFYKSCYNFYFSNFLSNNLYLFVNELIPVEINLFNNIDFNNFLNIKFVYCKLYFLIMYFKIKFFYKSELVFLSNSIVSNNFKSNNKVYGLSMFINSYNIFKFLKILKNLIFNPFFIFYKGYIVTKWNINNISLFKNYFLFLVIFLLLNKFLRLMLLF